MINYILDVWFIISMSKKEEWLDLKEQLFLLISYKSKKEHELQLLLLGLKFLTHNYRVNNLNTIRKIILYIKRD